MPAGIQRLQRPKLFCVEVNPSEEESDFKMFDSLQDRQDFLKHWITAFQLSFPCFSFLNNYHIS